MLTKKQLQQLKETQKNYHWPDAENEELEQLVREGITYRTIIDNLSMFSFSSKSAESIKNKFYKVKNSIKVNSFHEKK